MYNNPDHYSQHIQTEVVPQTKSSDWYGPGLSDCQPYPMSSSSSIVEFNKKDFFVMAGKVQKFLGFVAKGLARAYFIDQDGNETTVGFFSEGDFAADYPAFLRKEPSNYLIQCLEPTRMICIPFEDLNQICSHSPPAENYRCLIAEELVKRQQVRLDSFILQRAEQRYLDFIRQQPRLFGRISLSHLCSYLGIERQTLTRIRQRLAHQ